MGFTKYHFTHIHIIIRKLKHLKNKINYIIGITNHIFGSGYHNYFTALLFMTHPTSSKL